MCMLRLPLRALEFHLGADYTKAEGVGGAIQLCFKGPVRGALVGRRVRSRGLVD